MTAAPQHRRPIAVILGEFLATLSDHILDHGKPDSFDLWARTLLEHMRREGFTVRDETPTEMEIGRLLRQIAALSEMADRVRGYWIKAGTMALAGDTLELERALEQAERCTPPVDDDQPAVDQIIRNVRLKFRTAKIADLAPVVHDLRRNWETNRPPDETKLAYLLCYVIDEMVEREKAGDILF